jgi:hypothetical protein
VFGRKTKRRPNADFDWREVVCSSESAAKAEAEKLQSTEDPDEVEWVYLHKESTGEWIARRTPRHMEPPRKSFGDVLFDVFSP